MKWRNFVGAVIGATVIAGLATGCGAAKEESEPAVAEETTEESDGQEAAEESEEAEEVDDELADILEAGKIIVGVEGTYPPFTYHDEDGTLIGYDVEVAQKIAEALGVEAEFVESDWDSLLAGVDSGRMDTVINDVTITEERAEKYDFSDPYYFNSRQIIVKKGNPQNITSLEDLAGKKVATNSTNAYIAEFEALGVEIVPIDSSEEQANLLLSGRTDFGTFSSVTLADYLEQHPDAELEVGFVIPDSEEQIAIPVRKGETRLLEAINDALKDLADSGTLTELSEKYFHADYSKSQAN